MAESLTTQVLIEQVQAGDRAALNVLCDRYLMRVLSAVRIRLGAKLRQKVDSWDLVQQVMLDALGKVQSFDFRSEGAFLNYLNRVVETKFGTRRTNGKPSDAIQNARFPSKLRVRPAPRARLR